MKRLLYFATLLSVVFFASCGGSETKEGAESAEGAEEVKAPVITINEADWVEKDLSTVSPMIHVTMKVPKDAVLEKNGNGGVDIKVSDIYTLTVSSLFVSKLQEAKDGDVKYTSGSSSYQNGKLITDEPNGFICTYQMKDEANGHKYQPEAHFYYYLEKEGAYYSVHDQRDFNTPEASYSEALAKQVYGIVKASAKAN